MNNSRRSSSLRWIIPLLLLALFLTACQDAAPEPTPAPTSPPATAAPQATPETEPTALPEPTAEPEPILEPTLRLEPSVIAVGDTVTLTGEGFPPAATLALRLVPSGAGPAPDAIAGASSGAEGRASLNFDMPGSLPDGTGLAPGDYTFVLSTDDGTVSASAPFTLVAGDPAAAAAQAARAALAAAQNLAPEAVEISAVEPADWSDSCLGLGGPAESCLAVITPGYQVTLSAGGETIVYRTNADASSIRREDASGGEAEALPAAIASAGLANALGLDEEAIAVSDVIARDWSDACLGLGAPDELCAAVITPGYEVVLAVAGRNITYRTDATGGLVRLAGASAPAPDDVVLSWGREGGIAGFCDDLRLTAAGEVLAGSCRATDPAESGVLTPEQGAQLDEWLSTYRAFDRMVSDDAVADSMTVDLLFLGTGSETPTSAAVDEMLAFASEVHFAQSQPAEPAPIETPEATPEPGATPAPTGAAWERFLVEPLDMSFPIRTAWSRVDEAFVWTTSDGGQVQFAAPGAVADPLSVLPAGSQVVRSAATDQGWAAGTFYRTTAPDSLGTLFGASYILTDPDGQTFVFSASATDATALAALEADLGRMVGAVAFSEGEDKVSGPTQVTIDFFAAWLNGEDLDSYLSGALRDRVAAGTSLASALGLPGDNFRSFTVAWIQTGGGRSQVRATLTYDGGPQTRTVNLVQEGGVWVIDSAEQ